MPVRFELSTTSSQSLPYGGGSLWVADVSRGELESNGVTEPNPRTGMQRRIELDTVPAR